MLTNIANYIHEKFLRYLILKIFLNKIFASNLMFINQFRFSPKIPHP